MPTTLTQVPQDGSLSSAISPQDQVKMIVIGSSGRAPQLAQWARGAAQNAEQPSGFNARKPIWAPDPAVVAADLNTIVAPPYPTILVLNRNNSISGRVTDNGTNINGIMIEQMYLDAGA